MGEGSLPAEIQAAVDRGETLTPAQYADVLLFQIRNDALDLEGWTSAGPRPSESVPGCREIVLSGPLLGRTLALRRLYTADGSPHSSAYFFRLAVITAGDDAVTQSDDATSATARAVKGMLDAVALGATPVGSVPFINGVIAHLSARFERDGLDGWEIAGPESLREGTGSVTRFLSLAGLSTAVVSIEQRMTHEDVAVRRYMLEVFREDVLIGRRGTAAPGSPLGELGGKLEASLHQRVRALQEATTRELS